ncbi:MAG TPA: hypothetical protein VL095_06505 [Flavisolibacter sp.]|nr:hypothetical protein [Flavisolibacter sp.]
MRLLIFSLLFSTLCSGQSISSIENQVNDFKDSLWQNKVDTFLLFLEPCVGGVRPDTCNYFDAHYLFWIQSGMTYVRRFDGCKTYQQALLDTFNPLQYYFRYKKQIDIEAIKTPTYIQSRKGNAQTKISQTIDHTCFYEMTFYVKAKKTFKSVSYYDLNFEKFENGKTNIYYKYNQNTKLKQLIDQLTELTNELR